MRKIALVVLVLCGWFNARGQVIISQPYTFLKNVLAKDTLRAYLSPSNGLDVINLNYFNAHSGGSTGINGLNGTTNIGLGGTLSQNTTVHNGGFYFRLDSMSLISGLNKSYFTPGVVNVVNNLGAAGFSANEFLMKYMSGSDTAFRIHTGPKDSVKTFPWYMQSDFYFQNNGHIVKADSFQVANVTANPLSAINLAYFQTHADTSVTNNIYHNNGTVTAGDTRIVEIPTTSSLTFIAPTGTGSTGNTFEMSTAGFSMNAFAGGSPAGFFATDGSAIMYSGVGGAGNAPSSITVTTGTPTTRDDGNGIGFLGFDDYSAGALTNSLAYLQTIGVKTLVHDSLAAHPSGTTTNAVTFNNSGSGAASGTTFNGATARTISYNTIGAQVAGTYVTSVGVASANGLSGTSSGGATPSLTLTLNTIKPNVVAQTPTGTAGTDSVVVKHSGGVLEAISPNYYLPTTTAASTYQTLANIQTTLDNSTTHYPSTSAVKTAIAALDAPASYLGQVATRSLMTNTQLPNNSGEWEMSRSMHWSRAVIVNPTLVMPSFFVNTSNVETAVTGGTIKVSIEYPAGTFTLSDQNIAAGNAAVSQSTLTVLTFTITIPENAQFWVRTLQVNSNGPVYSGLPAYTLDPSDGFEFGTGTPTDLTTSGTVSFGGFYYSPILILAQTIQPSFCIIGDSREIAGGEVATDATADIGQDARTIGKVYGYGSLSNSSTTISAFLSATKTIRNQILQGTISGISGTPYFTHIIDAYGVNDLGAGTTATLITNRASFAALYPGSTVIGITLYPNTSTTDNWATTTNQSPTTSETKMLVFNDAVRAGISGEKFYFDIADAVDPYRLGFYPVSRNFNNSTMPNTVSATGAISGTTMTITAVASGTFKLGDPIFCTGIWPGTIITAFGTGTGNTGTYTVNLPYSGFPYNNAITSTAITTAGYGTNDGLHATWMVNKSIQAYLTAYLTLIKR